MKIDKLYIYPIKSLRGISLDSSTVTKHGLQHDRRFMLLKLEQCEQATSNAENNAAAAASCTYTNMAVSEFNQMVLFHPTLHVPDPNDLSTATISVAHTPAGACENGGGETSTLDSIPLRPSVAALEQITVTMHLSRTHAYRMPERINDWFSARFGFECVLAYIGPHARRTRFVGLSERSSSRSVDSAAATPDGSSWFGGMASRAGRMIFGAGGGWRQQEEEEGNGQGDGGGKGEELTFSDCAPYLVVSRTSLADVSQRLQGKEEDGAKGRGGKEGEEFDITKFRPNIIVSGAEEAWEEDYWAQLTIGGREDEGDGVRVECEHNCARCSSINIDYATGEQGTGEAGTMLKKLAKDRRVDMGARWSPVFGRYSFLHPESEGREIHVGEEVAVSRRNNERTNFDWRGICTLPGLRASDC